MKATTSDEMILLVDDDEIFRKSLKEHLEADGFQVIAAEGRKTAEELLQKMRPDLAIVNLCMEEMDSGFVLSYHIKKLDPSVPVIMITASLNEARMVFDTTTTEERTWIKADALIEKPLRFEQVEREIARLLKEGVYEEAHGQAKVKSSTHAA